MNHDLRYLRIIISIPLTATLCDCIVYAGQGRILIDPYSAGIDFSRQNLTSVDVRF